MTMPANAELTSDHAPEDDPKEGAGPELVGRSPGQLAWIRFKRDKIALVCTGIVLLYFLVATGNKAPSFNDTVDVDPAHPGTHLVTPPVGPEKSTMFEIGSRVKSQE